MKQEAKHLAPPEKGRSRAPLIVIIVLAVLIAAYLGFCAWVQQSDTFWRGAVILGQDVTGQTQAEAVKTIDDALPELGQEPAPVRSPPLSPGSAGGGDRPRGGAGRQHPPL